MQPGIYNVSHPPSLSFHCRSAFYQLTLFDARIIFVPRGRYLHLGSYCFTCPTCGIPPDFPGIRICLSSRVRF